MKKYLFAGLLGLLLLSYLPASAMTQQDIQSQIQELMQQVQALQAKLSMPGGSGGQNVPIPSSTSSQTSPSSTGEFCYTFTQNLKMGDGSTGIDGKDNDVQALQTALEKEGFLISDSEKKGGSVFGESTAAAVVGFQEKYASEILTPNGLAHGTGFVGASTRAKLNALYGCDNTTTSTDTKPKTDIKLAADEVTQTSIKLNWSPRINFSAISPTKYVLYRGSTVIYSGQAFSFTDTGLQCGTSYIYKLVATGGSGFSDVVTNETYGPITTQTDSCGGTATTTPSITIISPNGGEVYKAGNPITIRFSNNFPIGPTSVHFYRNGQLMNDVGYNQGFSAGVNSIQVYPAKGSSYSNDDFTGQFMLKVCNVSPPGSSSNSICSNLSNLFTITSSSTPTTGLAAPTGVTASAVSQTASLLTWNPVTGADGYNIYESGSLKSRVRGATFWYDTNLSCGTTHTYAVEAFHYDSNWNLVPSGNLSSYVISQTKSCSDAKPYIKVTSPNGGETYKPGSTVRITWIATGVTDNANSIGVNIFKYRSDNNYYGVKPEFGVTVSNFVTNGVIQDNGSYDWTIPATYSGQYVIMVGGGPYGLKDYSDGAFTVSNTTSSSSITVISPSGGGLKIGSTQIIEWSPADYYSDAIIDLFQVNGNSHNLVKRLFDLRAVVNSGTHSWTIDNTLQPGSNYVIGIKYYKGNYIYTSDYSYSNQFSLVVPSSNNPVIYGVSGPQQLNINQQGTWSISASDSSGGSLSYSVDWGDTKVVCQSGYMCANAIMPSTQQSATFTHTYNSAGTFSPVFTVTNSSGQSAQTSLSVEVTPSSSVNARPRIISGTAPSSVVSGQTASFGWTAEDADNDDLSWSISWGDGTGVTSACSLGPISGSKRNWTTSASHAWINGGTYVVKAEVSDCKGGSDSSSVNVNVLLTTSQVPTTPTSFSASGVSTSQIVVSWAPVSGATSYTVTRYPGGGIVYTGSNTSVSDTGLQCGTTYTYTVSASNSSGTSSTASASASTSSCSSIPILINPMVPAPTTPTSFSASGMSTSQIVMSWAPVSGATSYTVTRYPGGAVIYTGSNTSASDSGLSCNTAYTYTVYASNSSGSSATASASASTSVCSTTTPPAQMSVPAVSATQSNQLQASILEVMRGLLNTMLQAVQ